jgi:hypothetical protein
MRVKTATNSPWYSLRRPFLVQPILLATMLENSDGVFSAVTRPSHKFVQDPCLTVIICLQVPMTNGFWETRECLTYRTEEINEMKGVLWIQAFHQLTLVVAKDEQTHIFVQCLQLS